MKDLLQGALMVAGACASAGAFAAINVTKQNTDRGTFALGVQKDANGQSTGKGGIDLDVGVGAALVLVAAVAASKYPTAAAASAALGVGGLACFAAREGAVYGSKQLQQAQPPAAMLVPPTASVNGMPYGSFSGYQPQYGAGIHAAPFVAGFANAQPVYAAR